MSINASIDKERYWLEVYNTILLAVATLGVAWCTYQGSLWNGVQTFRLADSNKYSRLVQSASIDANQKMTMEEVVVVNFMDAVFEKNERRADYILKVLRPELSKILSDWRQLMFIHDSMVPVSLMNMPGYQEIMKKRLAESENLGRKATEAFNEGNKANRIADTYGLFTVMFSMVMFLGAITTKLVHRRVRLAVVVVSGLICIAALLLVIFSMPIALRE